MSDQKKSQLAETMSRVVSEKRSSVPIRFVAQDSTEAARGRMEMVLHRNRILASVTPK